MLKGKCQKQSKLCHLFRTVSSRKASHSTFSQKPSKFHHLLHASLLILLTLSQILPTPLALAYNQDLWIQNYIIGYDPNESDDGTCTTSSNPGNAKVTLIGDSISNASKDAIKAAIPNIDLENKTYSGVTYQLVQNSKHFKQSVGDNYSGIKIAEVLQQQGELGSYLIFALGTNDEDNNIGPDINELMNIIGSSHNIIFVTNYKYNQPDFYNGNNTAIREAAETYNSVTIADWAAAVQDDPDKYIGDKDVHPNADGQKLFAKILSEALGNRVITSSSHGTGNNKDYAGNDILSEAQLSAIRAHQPFYEQAAKEVGIPWQMLAVVHIRESGLSRKNPDGNDDGVYQIIEYAPGWTPGHVLSDDEFLEQSIYAAKFLKEKNSNLTLNSSDDEIKKTFFAYNGMARVYKEQALNLGFTQAQADIGEGSPYVMNRADAKRDPNINPNSWGQIKTDGGGIQYPANQDYGAFVMYAALGGSTTSSYCGGTVNTVSGAVSTVAETLPFLQQYIKDLNSTYGTNFPTPTSIDESSHVAEPLTPNSHYAAGGCKWGGWDCGQCTALSGWFVSMFTKYEYKGGNGDEVVGKLAAKYPEVGVSNTPVVFSIFSMSRGHTGIVVGQTSDGLWITIENNYGPSSGGNGGSGRLAANTYSDSSFQSKGGGKTTFFNVNEGIDLSHIGS